MSGLTVVFPTSAYAVSVLVSVNIISFAKKCFVLIVRNEFSVLAIGLIAVLISFLLFISVFVFSSAIENNFPNNGR